MRLLLTVISEEQVDLGHRVRCEFDQKGGTIGRNGNCHWVLPDPTNTLSARHALVSHNGRGFLITDTSTNGVYLNSVDAPIGRGNEAVLSDGDTLYFGHHVILVEFLPDKAPEREQPRAAAPIGDNIPSAPRAAARPPLSFDLPEGASFPSAPAPWEQQPQPVPAVRPAARRESWAGSREPGLNGASAASMDDLLGRAGPARAPHLAPPAPISTGPSPPPVIPPSPQPAQAPRQPAPLLIPDDFLSDLLGPPMPGPPRGTGSMRDTGSGSARIPDAADFGLPPPESPRATASPKASAPDPFRASPLAQAPGETGPAGMSPPAGRAALPPEPKATTPELPRRADGRAPAEERAFRTPPRKSLSDDMVTLRQPGQEEPGDGLSALDPVAILRRRGTAGAVRPLAGPDLAADLMPPRQAPVGDAVPVQPPRARATETMPLPGPASSRSAAAVSSPGPSSSAACFWQALGVDAAELPPAQADRLLGELGLALREALNGMVPVLAARRSLKDALRMEQTQLQGQENNPLKFLPSGDAVLQALMAHKLSGFMSLSQAVAQGFRDIKAHEVAAVVSLRAVIKNLIGRFDPAALEAQAGSGKLFGRGADKGRLWDQFVSLHASLAGKSDETTRKIVNEEFSRAYAEQVQNSGNGDQ